ncbi:hypothetical protein P7K49_000095 [Saguinus oedipus]|uniref:Uncharacterized protein n=1 Tax=Saguinus oedipus TaxID=9490 RepID=A0ABQ9WAR0_SAGOE|nr:hypothetical protein P7K49_000095 [Saguinus oedipus]
MTALFSQAVPSSQFITGGAVMVPLPRTSFGGFLLLSSAPHPSFLVQRRGLIASGVLKNKWSILYLLLSLSEDPRRQPSKVGGFAFPALCLSDSLADFGRKQLLQLRKYGGQQQACPAIEGQEYVRANWVLCISESGIIKYSPVRDIGAEEAEAVSSYATLFAQALPRDAHSTPYYYARPQTLPLSYQDRSTQSAQSSGSLGSSGISSIGLCALSGPTPAPQSLLPGQSHQAPGAGDCLRQQLGSRLAWTLTANQPSSQVTTSKGVPNALCRNMTRSRREGDTGGE